MKLTTAYPNLADLLQVKINALDKQDLDKHLKRVILAEYRSHSICRRAPRKYHYQMRIRRLKVVKAYEMKIGELPIAVKRPTLPYACWPGLVQLLDLKSI